MCSSTRYRNVGGPRGLRKIGDSFRKLVVVDGVQPFYTDESGVSFVGLMDFMLNREVLA